MEDWKLWEKIVVVTTWTLMVLFLIAGIFGGLSYLIREILIK